MVATALAGIAVQVHADLLWGVGNWQAWLTALVGGGPAPQRRGRLQVLPLWREVPWKAAAGLRGEVSLSALLVQQLAPWEQQVREPTALPLGLEANLH